VQIFVNEKGTRTFLAVTPGSVKACTLIVDLIRKVDKVLVWHRLQPFFASPRPHVSVLSWDGDCATVVQRQLHQLQQIWEASFRGWAVNVRVSSIHES
jgi:hypothetical protein